MEKIEPTKKQVFDELRYSIGCCWLGGTGCQCYIRQLYYCFNETKKRLTKTEYTEEEIKEAQARNAEAMDNIKKALDNFHGIEGGK